MTGLRNAILEFTAQPLLFRINLSSYMHPAVPPVRWSLIGAACALAGFIAWDLVDGYHLYGDLLDLRASVVRLQEQDRQLSEAAQREGIDLTDSALQRLPAEVAFINSLVEQREFSWTAFLSELEKTVPSRVGISSIRLDPASAAIRLSGSAVTFEDATSFLTALQDHPTFRDPVLIQHQIREDGLVEFHVQIQYRGHAKRRAT
ncbi:MAG: PilN domain-containing protein [Nitrospiraceae bacterium]